MSSEGLSILPLEDYEKNKGSQKVKSFNRFFKNVMPSRKGRHFDLDNLDSVYIVLFTALGMLTRVFRIQSPPTVVYNEEYYGNYTNFYLRGTYFYDPEPPLAKLIMASVSYFTGYKGEYEFSLLNGRRYPSMTYVALRLTPAFFGALCVPLTYLIIRAMGCSHFSSATGALLVLSDEMLIVEARHIFAESFLHLFSCLAILSIYIFDIYETWVAFIFECITLGLAFSCNYSAGGIIVLAVLKQFRRTAAFRRFAPRGDTDQPEDVRFPATRAGILLTAVLAIHVVVFGLHLSALPYRPDDPTPMPRLVEASLLDRMNPDWEVRGAAATSVLRVASLLVFRAFHPPSRPPRADSSPWLSWPLGQCRAVRMWAGDGHHVAAVPSVLLWVPVFVGIVAAVVRAALFGDRGIPAELAVAYTLCLLHFLGRADATLTDYALPLLIGCMALPVLLEGALPPRSRAFALCTIATAAVAGFFTWAPFAYALTTPDLPFLVWSNKWFPESL